MTENDDLAKKTAKEILELLNSHYPDRIARGNKVLLANDSQLIIKIIKHLINSGDYGVVRLFKTLYRKVDKPVLLEIISSCGQMKGIHAESILTNTLLHEDKTVRVEACNSVGKLADRSFYFHLIKRLEDNEPLVRESAAKALENLNMTSAIKHLEKLINNPQEVPSIKKYIQSIIKKLSTNSKTN